MNNSRVSLSARWSARSALAAIAASLAVSCLFVLPSEAAQIVKCKSTTGGLIFTQGACPPGSSPADAPEPTVGPTKAPADTKLEAAPTSATQADAAKQPAEKQACANANDTSCVKTECTTQAMQRNAESDVRQCAATKGYPSGTDWAQFNQQDRADFTTYDIVCLQPSRQLITVTKYATRLASNPSLQGFIASSMPGKGFATLADAARAGCNAQAHSKH